MAPLFISEQLFEKTASDVRLPGDTKQWGAQILSELHKQAPYMAGYHCVVKMLRTEENQGYGFGYLVCMPKTINTGNKESLTTVRVPIIVKDWILCPLDTFFNEEGQGFYLSESAVSMYLLNPVIFDITKRKSMFFDMKAHMEPPWENVGAHFRGSNISVSTKQASLLPELDGLVEPEELSVLRDWLGSSEGRVCDHNYSTDMHKIASVLEAYTPKEEAEKIAAAVLWKEDDIYYIKTAAEDKPPSEKKEVPKEKVSPKLEKEVADKGEVVQGEGLEPEPSPVPEDSATLEAIERFGVYRCRTISGESVVGWVFPQLSSFDGSPVSMMVFTDGSQFSVQSSMLGSPIGQGENLPNDPPAGRGMFYHKYQGQIVPFVPVEISGEEINEDGTASYMVASMITGNEFKITKLAGTVAAAAAGEGEFIVPEDLGFVAFTKPMNPIMETAPVDQQVAPEQKMAALEMVIRVSPQGVYSVGGNAFEKVGEFNFIDKPTMLLLGAQVGIHPDTIREKIAAPYKIGGKLILSAKKKLGKEEEVPKPDVGSAKIASLSYRFFKEAAALEDATTADKLLALNFINNRTLPIFLRSIPELYKTMSKVASMLLMSRLGLEQVPEEACISVLEGLDKVIMGLQSVTLKRGKL